MKLHDNEIVRKIEEKAIKFIHESRLAGHSLKHVKPLEENISISELKHALNKVQMVELEIKSAACDKCGEHLTLRIYGDDVTASSQCKE